MKFPYKGYAGQVLRVNLTKHTVKKQALTKKMARGYIGGSGFAARMLYDEIDPGIDPLGPENKIFMGTGPLTGTFWPSSGRYMFATKSPLTGIWGESHSGGHMGPEVKYAGYDAVLLEGRAQNPVYLQIENEEVEIRDASHLWGKDTHETTRILHEDIDKEAQIACIGPAGENLVRYASVITNLYRAAGRAGLGAVMGSKKLKAIAVRGTRPVEVADFDRFMELSEEAHWRILSHPQAQAMSRYGTPLLVGYKQTIGELPTKNHQTGVFPQAEALSAETIRKNYWVKTRSCFACRTMCKKVNTARTGPYAGTLCEGPEYETIMAFGTNCYNADYPSILYANLLCDKYGMDTISTGCTIAFLMECYENGIVNKGDVEDTDLSWGNFDAIIALIHKIAKREGIGNLLAEGSYRAAKKIGKGAKKYALHVKKMEISGQDGRTHRSIGLSHATASRGADHLRSLVTVDQLGYEEVAARRWGSDKLPEVCDPYTEKWKALVVKTTEDVYAVRDCLIQCWYCVSWPPVLWIEDFANILPVATGEPAFGKIDELLLIGNRVVNLERCFNAREGITRKDDSLPERFLKEPMPDGPGKGQVVNLKVMLDEYYELRGWSLESGIPKRETLEKLGLRQEAGELEAMGKLSRNCVV